MTAPNKGAGSKSQAIFVVAAASGELLAARIVDLGVGEEAMRVDDLLDAASADTATPSARSNT